MQVSKSRAKVYLTAHMMHHFMFGVKQLFVISQFKSLIRLHHFVFKEDYKNEIERTGKAEFLEVGGQGCEAVF